MSGGAEHLSSEFAESLQRARDAYAAGDPAACREHLERARLLDPDSMELKRWQARLAWREGDWKTLGEVAQDYLKVRPSDREMAQLGARALSNSKQWSAAAQAWQRVIELRPEWPEAWFQFSRAQLRADLPYEAAASAKRLRAIAGGDAVLASARLAVERAQMSEAAQDFARLAAEAPDRVLKELHDCERKGDFRAVALTSMALGNLPENDAHQRTSRAIARDLLPLAVANERQGRALDAYLDYSVLALVEPDDMVAKTGVRRTMQFLQDAARDQIAAGDRKRAYKAYLQILYCQPGDGRALAALGQIAMADQDWPKAARIWASFLEISPGDAKASVQRARALDRAQEFAAALAAWHCVLSLEADNIEAQLAIAKLPSRIVKAGRQAVEERRYVEAADILALVPPDCPERADAARRLDQVSRYLRKEMRTAYKERRFEWVVRYGAAACSIAQDDEDVQRLLAQAAMRTRDYAIAANAWSRLMELAPAVHPSASLQLARCHLRLGQREEGLAALAGLLRDDPHNAEANALALEFEVAQTHVQVASSE